MIAAVLKAPVAAAYLLAAMGGCDAPPAPAVDFQYAMRPPALHSDQSSAGLEQMKGEIDTGEGRIGGLTRAQVARDVNMTTLQKEDVLAGGYCLWPSALVIKVELQPTVWVASEYAAGSCRYNVAYVHEMLHVKIARDTLAEFMPGIEQLARATALAVGGAGPMAEGDIRAAQDKMLATVNDALGEALGRVEMVLEQRQAVIDTPEAYRQASNACGNEAQWGRR